MDINPWISKNVKEEEEGAEEVEDNVEAAEEIEEIEEVAEEVALTDINAGAVVEGVDRLVEAINNAVATIEDLRRENAELKQQSQALQSDISRLEEERVALCNERDRLQDIYNDNMLLIDNKAEILDKVEAMLQRLNSLNPEKNE